jgi:L-amino acid N-acyltransferase YncA
MTSAASTSSHVSIRPAVEEDLPALLAIYNYEVEHGTATYDLAPATLEERRAWMAAHDTGDAALTGTHPLVVAEVDGATGPVGYASLSAWRGKGGYVGTAELSVYVHQDWRGRGIGSALMEWVLGYARACDGLHCILSVIDSSNTGSIRLHERLGFAEVGRMHESARKFDRWLDDVILELLV